MNNEKGIIVLHRPTEESFTGFMVDRQIQVNKWFAWRPVKGTHSWHWMKKVWRVECLKISDDLRADVKVEFHDFASPTIRVAG